MRDAQIALSRCSRRRPSHGQAGVYDCFQRERGVRRGLQAARQCRPVNVSAFAKASAQCHRVLRMHSCAADFLRRTSEQLILRILRRIRLAGKQKAVAEPDFAFAAADDPSSGFDGKKRLHLVVRQSAGYAFSALSRWVRQHIKLPCVGLKGNTPSPASIAATRASLFQTELCGFRNWHPQFPLSRSLGLRSRTRPNPAKSESFRIPFFARLDVPNRQAFRTKNISLRF